MLRTQIGVSGKYGQKWFWPIFAESGSGLLSWIYASRWPF
jgi:hypothetical protein